MATVEAGSGGALERFFKFKQWDTSIKRDTLAGLATFMVMAYIIFVNPNILGLGGDSRGSPVRRRAHVDVSRRRRDDHPHGSGHQPRLRHRARHGPQRGRGLQPRPRPGAHHGERHGPHRPRGRRHHRARAHRLPGGDLQGDPDRAQEGDRRRHRLLHPLHRARRRRSHQRERRHAGRARRARHRAERAASPSPCSPSSRPSSCWRCAGAPRSCSASSSRPCSRSS